MSSIFEGVLDAFKLIGFQPNFKHSSLRAYARIVVPNKLAQAKLVMKKEGISLDTLGKGRTSSKNSNIRIQNPNSDLNYSQGSDERKLEA